MKKQTKPRIKKQIKLINPGSQPIFGGVYLDLWSGYGLSYALFQINQNDSHQITMMDNYGRGFHSGDRLDRKEFSDIYWSLIRHGWKEIGGSSQRFPEYAPQQYGI